MMGIAGVRPFYGSWRAKGFGLPLSCDAVTAQLQLGLLDWLVMSSRSGNSDTGIEGSGSVKIWAVRFFRFRWSP